MRRAPVIAVAAVVLLALAMFTSGSFASLLRVGLLVALTAFSVRAWRRRRYTFPADLTLYSIALARQVSDGPARMASFLDAVHHQTRRHPLVLALLAASEDETEDTAAAHDAPRLTYVVGLPAAIGERGKDALLSAFSGTGCVVRALPPTEWPLYGPVFAAWDADAAEHERRELAARERRDEMNASSCRGFNRAYRLAHEQLRLSLTRLTEAARS